MWALLSAVGIFAAACASASGGTSHSGLSGQPLPSPATTVERGVTYTVQSVPAVAATTDATDPAAVTVFIYRVEQPTNPRCAQLNPSARVEREDGRSVVISSFAYRVPSKGSMICGSLSLADAAPPYAPVRLHLSGPLGSRSLLDAKSGKVIGIANGQQVPTPGYVPAGFRPSLNRPFNAASDFVAIRQYLDRSGNDIEIRLRSATATAQGGDILGQATIGDAPAVISQESYERCVEWIDSTQLVHEVCSIAPSGAYLSSEVLLRIARSLP